MSSKDLKEINIKNLNDENKLKSFEDKEKININDDEQNIIKSKIKSSKSKSEKKMNNNGKQYNIVVDEKKNKDEITNEETNCKEKKRVGRPLSDTYGRKVTIHKTNNYRYLSLQHKKVVNGKELYCHFHLGRLDENNEFIPSINYILSPAEFRNNLIFPGSVKMNIVDNMKEGWSSNMLFSTQTTTVSKINDNIIKPKVVAGDDNVILPVKKKVSTKEKIRKEEKEKIIEVELEKNKSKNKILEKEKIKEKEKELEFVK